MAFITSGGAGGGGGGSGDVVGPASATDNAIVRYNGATGKAVQNSGVIIDDSNNVTGIVSLTVTTLVATTTVTTGDNIIVLNDDEAGTPSQNAGIEVERGTSTNVQTLWNETSDRWQAGVVGALSNIVREVDLVSTDGSVSISGSDLSVVASVVAGTKEIIFQHGGATASYKTYSVDNVSGTGNTNISFAIPTDFNALVALEVILTPLAGANGSGKDIDLTSNYGAIGEGTSNHSETDLISTYDLGSADEWIAIDVSHVFTTIAAADFCGLNWDNKSIGGAIKIFGIRLRYTT